MPRKTDGIEIEIHPGPRKGEDGKPLLYVRPAKGHKKTVADMEQFCAKYRGLSRSEFIRVFELALELTTMWLKDGYRVETLFGSLALISTGVLINIHDRQRLLTSLLRPCYIPYKSLLGRGSSPCWL